MRLLCIDGPKHLIEIDGDKLYNTAAFIGAGRIDSQISKERRPEFYRDIARPDAYGPAE